VAVSGIFLLSTFLFCAASMVERFQAVTGVGIYFLLSIFFQTDPGEEDGFCFSSSGLEPGRFFGISRAGPTPKGAVWTVETTKQTMPVKPTTRAFSFNPINRHTQLSEKKLTTRGVESKRKSAKKQTQTLNNTIQYFPSSFRPKSTSI